MEDLRFDAEIPQGLGHLHPDESRPDDDRLPAGNLAEPGLDPDRVREFLQREDPLQRLSRYSRQKRRCSRPQDDDIVGQGLPAGQANPSLLRIDLLNAGVDPYIDPRLPELLRRPRDQILFVLDYITDLIC